MEDNNLLTVCPVCRRPFTDQKDCACGFSGLRHDMPLAEMYFKMYKYVKRVMYGEAEFVPAKLFTENNKGQLYVRSVRDERGAAFILCPRGPVSVVCQGVFAFTDDIYAAAVNCTYLSAEFAYESAVSAVFIGPDVTRIVGASKPSAPEYGFMQNNPLRYIEVSPQNKWYTAVDNVLFGKSGKRLVCYASARPDEEYRVPQTVNEVAPRAFMFPKYLKKLYIPKGAYCHPGAVWVDENFTEVIKY